MKKNLTKEEVFNQIAYASVMEGRLGLFIGAGFSMAVFDDETPDLVKSNISSKPLSWTALLEKVCTNLGVQFDQIKKEGVSCPEIASDICKKIAEKDGITQGEAQAKLKNTICKLVSWYPNKDQRNVFAKEIKNLNPSWIVTTNYDLVIEGLLPDKAKSIRPYEIISCSREQTPVYHMHGIKTDPNSIVITNEDYIKLFRPDEYRQHRLPFLFMESTTLAIGYGVGDTNVLTALDWKENVYQEKGMSTRGQFIQLAYTDHPKETPYEINGIIVIETNSILNSLREINEYVDKKNKEKNAYDLIVENIVKYYESLDQDKIDEFIDNDEKKNPFVLSINNAPNRVSSLGCTLLSRVLDRCWQRCSRDGAFDEYAKLLHVLLYCMKNIQFENLSPALFELIASALGSLAYYVDIDDVSNINSYWGKSRPAKLLWDAEKDNIPSNYIDELKNYANGRTWPSDHLSKILDF